MSVLVADTSVLIDLERGNLIEAVFSSSIELAVPDLLYKRELRPYNGPKLLRLGLRVLELDPAGVQLALGYRQRSRSISLPNSFALALAKSLGHTVPIENPIQAKRPLSAGRGEAKASPERGGVGGTGVDLCGNRPSLVTRSGRAAGPRGEERPFRHTYPRGGTRGRSSHAARRS